MSAFLGAIQNATRSLLTPPRSIGSEQVEQWLKLAETEGNGSMAVGRCRPVNG